VSSGCCLGRVPLPPPLSIDRCGIDPLNKPHFFTAEKGLARARADCPAPIASPVAQVIEKRRVLLDRAAFDELRAVARDGPHFAVKVGVMSMTNEGRE
jgi:hypothetical protein